MASTRHLSATDLAALTPPDRDRFVDLARLASIAVVVVGHWLLVLVVHDGTAAPGRSPAAQAATWLLMVMPVFFAVGGYGHARALARPTRRRSYGSFVVARADRLLGPVLVLVAAWSVLAVLLDLTGMGRGPVGSALDLALSPLWFVGVYLVVVLAAPLMWSAHRRWGARVFLPIVGAVAAVDAVRHATGVEAVGLVNLVLVWSALHQLGFFWSDGTLTKGRRPLVLAVAGWGVALGLTVATGWYPVDMQGLPGHDGSNFSPPTLALLAHGVGLVGLVLAVRAPVDRWLTRPRAWAVVVAGNSVSLTAHCWHLTAAFAVLGVSMLAGLALPPALSLTWWALVPAWALLCAGVLLVLVRVLAPAERWSAVRPRDRANGDGVPDGERRAMLLRDAVAVTAVTVVSACVFGLSRVGLDGIAAGAAEPVAGVAVPAWVLLTGLAAGVLVLRSSGSRPTVAA